jgi:hypothetical protein
MPPFTTVDVKPTQNGKPSGAHHQSDRSQLVSFLQTSLAVVSGLAGTLIMASCGSTARAPEVQTLTIEGAVHGGQQPVTAGQIFLYTVSSAGNQTGGGNILSSPVYTSEGNGAMDATANASNGFNSFPAGSFTFSNYTCPGSDPDVYLVAAGGNPGMGSANGAIALMAALGDCDSLNAFTYVSINELTTVASVAALSTYMTAATSYANVGYQGTGPGNDLAAFDAAFASVQEYTNTNTGNLPGPTLPSGMYASSLELTALADALAPCVNSTGSTAPGAPCGELFTLATPPAPGSVAPTDTIAAAIDILNNPSNNTCAIYSLTTATAPYQPYAPGCPPAGWVFPIEPIVATPVFPEPAGSYASPFSFTITDATVDSTIYYTTDGSLPTVGGPTTTPCAPASNTATGLCTITGVMSGETVCAMATAPNSEFSAYVLAGVACVTYKVNPSTGPTQLVFSTQPGNTPVNTAISPAVQVVIEDSNGNIVTSATNQVSLAAGTGTVGLLSGGGAMPPGAGTGLVSFGALSVDTPQTGYTLVATSPGLVPATSASFIITNPLLTIAPATPATVANNLVGTGKPLPGQVCIPAALPAASPALVVNLSSSVPADVAITTSPATVTFPAGSPAGTCEMFIYTGGTIGASTLTASAAGYVSASMQITSTNALVSLGQLSTIAPGQTSQIALSLGTTAPAEVNGLPLEVTMTEVNVSGTATVAPAQVPIYPGLQVPQQNPTITGDTFGTVWVFATAPNYAGDAALVDVTLTASMPASETIPLGQTTNVVLTLSAPAVAGMSFNLVATPAGGAATVQANVPVTIGSTTVNIPIQGQNLGTSTVTATCTCFASVTASTQVTVAGTFSASNVTTGNQLYSPVSTSLTVAPASPVNVTITSQSAAVALVSTVNTAFGTVGPLGVSQIVFNSINSTSIPTFYIQGVSVGSTTLNYHAPGYADANVSLTVLPSGFVLLTGNAAGLPFTTTTQSGTTPIYVDLVMLNSSSLAVYESCSYFGACGLNPGVTPNVVVQSSNNATVGSVPATPIAFSGSGVQESTPFTPIAGGTTIISIPAQPAGFNASSDSTMLNGTVTVTAPKLSVNGSITTGQGLYVSGGQVGLQVAPHTAAVNVQLSVPMGCGALLSSNSSTVGSNVLNFPGISSTGTPTFYVQGQNIGQGQAAVNCALQVTAPGYTTANATITVNPSGFVMQGQNLQNGITTTTFSSPSPIDVTAAILNTPSLTVSTVCSYFSACAINPGTGPFNVPVTITGTAGVGSILNSPAVFNAGSTDVTLSFSPSSGGTTQFSVGAQPAGFYATTSAFNPNNYYAVYGLVANATVTAPAISGIGNWAGVGLQSALSPSLPVGPPAPVTVTICSDNPAALVLSYNNTTLGTSSATPCGPSMVSPSSTLTFTNINSTSIPQIYQQALSNGTGSATAHIYVSAPGYTTGVGSSTVYPSGFVFDGTPTIATTTFSSPSTIYVTPSILDPNTLAIANVGIYGGLCVNFGCSINPYPATPCTTQVVACPPVGPYSVAVISSNTGVGKISSSPLVFAAGDVYHTTTFQPLTAGTSNLSIGTQPGAFSTPTQYVTGTATVTAPQITVGGAITGAGLYIGLPGPNLGATPPSPISVTITSNNPSALLISTDPTQVGTAQIVLPNVTSSGLPTLYLQGQPLGINTSATSTLSVSAPGYQTGSSTITVYPAGFVFGSNGYPGGPNISTTPFSSISTIYVTATPLVPGTLAYYGNYYGPNAINPGTGPFNVPIALSNGGTGVGNVGTLSGNAVFTSGTGTTSITFTPNVNASSTVTSSITLTQPTGFTATSSVNNPNDLAGTITVAPPQINVSPVTTGNGLWVNASTSLGVTPPDNVSITMTSSDATVALLSTSSTVLGLANANSGHSSEIKFQSSNSIYNGYYVQGVGVGTSTLTVCALGYTCGYATITVDPTGFVFYSTQTATFSTTTTSSPNSNIYVVPALLTPNTFAVIGQGGSLNPGTPTINVNLTLGGPAGGATITSPLQFPAGSNAESATFTPGPVAATPTLCITQPAGFTATSSVGYECGTVTVTGPNLALGVPNVTTGANLAVATAAYAATAPTSALSVTASVGTGALLSLTPTGAGSPNLALMIPANGTSSQTFYVQGVTGGSTPAIQVTDTLATGYAPGNGTVTVDDSGFVFTSGLPIATTTISQPTTLTIEPTLIAPGTLAVVTGAYGAGCPNQGCYLVSAQNVNLGTTVGSVGNLSSSSAAFVAGSQSTTVTFTPESTGSTTLSIASQPTGFTNTSSTNGTTYLSGLATVGLPTIVPASSTITTGVSLQVPLQFNLTQVASNVGTSVTATSSNSAVFVVSYAVGTVGSGSAPFNPTSTAAQTVYIQGIATGTATLTISSSGYASAYVNVTVDPSGFVITTPTITTTLESGTTAVSVQPAILTAGTLDYVGTALLTPGQGTLAIPISVQNAACGGFQPVGGGPAVTKLTLNFNSNDTTGGGNTLQTAAFAPETAPCSTNLILNGPFPGGFNFPAQEYQVAVTINP